ncbi:hypothetical protein Tco_1245891 [Tanacetum coccineum]
MCLCVFLNYYSPLLKWTTPTLLWRLEEEKARRRGKVYNWETATYGKIRYDEDVYDLGFIETEFSAIVFNDTSTSEAALSCEPTDLVKEISTNIGGEFMNLEILKCWSLETSRRLLFLINDQDIVNSCVFINDQDIVNSCAFINENSGSFEDSGRSDEEDSEDGAFSEEGGSETPQVRRSNKESRAPVRYSSSANYLLLTENSELESYSESLSSKESIQWRKAIIEETISLEKNQTCSLVRLPAGKKASQSLWMFMVKEEQDGSKRLVLSIVAAGAFLCSDMAEFNKPKWQLPLVFEMKDRCSEKHVLTVDSWNEEPCIDVHQVGDEIEVEVMRNFNWPSSELITEDGVLPEREELYTVQRKDQLAQIRTKCSLRMEVRHGCIPNRISVSRSWEEVLPKSRNDMPLRDKTIMLYADASNCDRIRVSREVNPVHEYYNGSRTSKDNEDLCWSTSFKTRRTQKTSLALEDFSSVCQTLGSRLPNSGSGLSVLIENLLKIGMLVWGEADSETLLKQESMKKAFQDMLHGLGEFNPTHAYYNGFRTSKDNEDPSWSTSFKTRRTQKTSSALEVL